MSQREETTHGGLGLVSEVSIPWTDGTPAKRVRISNRTESTHTETPARTYASVFASVKITPKQTRVWAHIH